MESNCLEANTLPEAPGTNIGQSVPLLCRSDSQSSSSHDSPSATLDKQESCADAAAVGVNLATVQCWVEQIDLFKEWLSCDVHDGKALRMSCSLCHKHQVWLRCLRNYSMSFIEGVTGSSPKDNIRKHSNSDMHKKACGIERTPDITISQIHSSSPLRKNLRKASSLFCICCSFTSFSTHLQGNSADLPFAISSLHALYVFMERLGAGSNNFRTWKVYWRCERERQSAIQRCTTLWSTAEDSQDI